MHDLFLPERVQRGTEKHGESGGINFITPNRVRTYDLLLRRQLLYPAELLARKNYVEKNQSCDMPRKNLHKAIIILPLRKAPEASLSGKQFNSLFKMMAERHSTD